MRGIRARLTLTLVALVALTAALLGVGSYAFVDSRLHEQVRADAERQAKFDLSDLVPNLGLPANPTAADVTARRVLQTFHERGVDVFVDVGSGEPLVLDVYRGTFSAVPSELKALVASGHLGYAWTRLAGSPVLVVGGRASPSGPAFYFIHDETGLEQTLDVLRIALGGGALALILVALVAARLVARGVLAPVEAAGRAAERIELGDLSARVPITSRDEFGSWAERFNRMAAALEETIQRLERSQAQNRRFVSDVAHELRTPLTALVAEASILREHLDDLPAGARRTGELLVDDVGRLRTLVDELMELSRFDAEAEKVIAQPTDLVRLIRTVVAARLPGANVELTVPGTEVSIETDPRRLERILGNLLDNAREHAPAAPVAVELDGADEAITIRVDDRGPGVDPDRLDRIFERFYKADPSRHGGSSGLGLAIAAEHAALLGGELRASNRPGGGLRMELRLPVTGSLRDGDPAATGGDDRGTQSIPPQEPPR
jgi:two-component system sensor histidine kinase MtrB